MLTQRRIWLLVLPMIALAIGLLTGCPALRSLLDNPPSAAISYSPTSPMVGATVTLDGSGSSDPQSYSLTYTWSLSGPTGSAAKLSATDQKLVTFVPDVQGDYTVSLDVTAATSTLSGSKTTTVTVGGLAPPKNLTATASSTAAKTIDLAWDASSVTGATYKVYRGAASGEQASTAIASPTTNSYSDNDSALKTDTKYYYYVTAITGETESEKSNEASAYPGGSANVTVN